MPKKKKDVIHEGWLLKSPPMKGVWKAASPITTFDSLYTRIFQRWKRRWFVLRQSEGLPDLFLLEYFTDRNCRNMKGGISLDKCEQVIVLILLKRSNQRVKITVYFKVDFFKIIG